MTTVSPELQTAIITFLLGGGAATAISAAAKGWLSLRTGARAHEREAVADLAKARDDAEDRYRAASADADYWHAIAGRYFFQLTRAGIDPDPADPRPPSERVQPGRPT